MRLLSFLTLVENHLRARQPDLPPGWTRRVSYHTGTAYFSHPVLGLTLTLRSCVLADAEHNLSASWHGMDGEVISSHSFFSGSTGFMWDTAAETVTDIMPSPALVARAPVVPENEAPAPELVTA